MTEIMKPKIMEFRARFPEFNGAIGDPPLTLTDEVIQGILDRAWELHSVSSSGCLLAAAHLYCNDALPSELDGGAGVVKSEMLGRKKVEYSTNAGEDERRAFWSTSKYGREFMLVEQRTTPQAFGILIGRP
ncbi:MAG: DUF4054 domain-containing protein [Gammaproteobacteria bacterium AqS3]|nr:DUF4054 domain-containing protein [Gammaproteobacteria bacterium AqS3]